MVQATLIIVDRVMRSVYVQVNPVIQKLEPSSEWFITDSFFLLLDPCDVTCSPSALLVVCDLQVQHSKLIITIKICKAAQQVFRVAIIMTVVIIMNLQFCT